jgi:1-acyl-sn-glycerol-3-phosphate acyltransferase
MIIAMNRINWLDIPVIGALLPFAYRLSWLAKSELFEKRPARPGGARRLGRRAAQRRHPPDLP